MKRFASGAAMVLVLAFAAGACGKKTPEIAPPPATTPAPDTKPAEPPPPPPPPASTPTATAPTEDELFAKETLAELNERAPLADILFGYDSVELNETARALLQKHIEFLKRWPTTKIVIEGHADSRGTNEYNLALGENRADAVRDYLVSLGLPNDRVTVVSKGEEQPFCQEETEACWQRNRIGHFIFTAK
ncbi:MAG: OmpA family protein [Acidobacteriota bacterium]|nr:OmpA family protein [Acidobacteriota bacterium]